MNSSLTPSQRNVPAEDQHLIIDNGPLNVASKILPPDDQQAPNESLHFWSGVTNAIHSKQFSQATNIKLELEEAQREKARQREKDGTTFQPVFFAHVTGNGGKPELTEKGQEVLERAQKGEWGLDGII